MIAVLACFTAFAQPKPGRERISMELPAAYRWKSQKIPKDTKAIRGTLYTVRTAAGETAPVDSILITTIDKRYYPMKAEGAPEEKWAYVKSACPQAALEIIDRKVASGRTAILYCISSPGETDSVCGSSVLLAYIVEGPTALHTIELHIPVTQYSPEMAAMWRDILLAAVIS